MLRLLGGLTLLALFAGGIFYYYSKDKESVRKAKEEAAKIAETLREKATNPSGGNFEQSYIQPPGSAGTAEPPNADVEGPPNKKAADGQGLRAIGVVTADRAEGIASESRGEVVHVVASGDTLGRIAKRYYGEEGLYTLIAKANKIDRPNRLKVGQKLVIPPKPQADPGSAESSHPAESSVSSERSGGTANGASENLRPATLNKVVPYKK